VVEEHSWWDDSAIVESQSGCISIIFLGILNRGEREKKGLRELIVQDDMSTAGICICMDNVNGTMKSQILNFQKAKKKKEDY
jgi:formylmethanofuran dehydrogenase subunit E-like metal-binding protein